MTRMKKRDMKCKGRSLFTDCAEGHRYYRGRLKNDGHSLLKDSSNELIDNLTDDTQYTKFFLKPVSIKLSGRRDTEEVEYQNYATDIVST